MKNRNRKFQQQLAKQKTSCNYPEIEECAINHCQCARNILIQQVAQEMQATFDEQCFYVTICLSTHYQWQGKLKELSQTKLKRELRTICTNAGIEQALGGIDIQYLYMPEKGTGLWQPHVHFVCRYYGSANELHILLTKQVAQDQYCKKPVDVRAIYLWPLNTSYLFKKPECMVLRLWEEGRMLRGKTHIHGKALKELKDYVQKNELPEWVWRID